MYPLDKCVFAPSDSSAAASAYIPSIWDEDGRPLVDHSSKVSPKSLGDTADPVAGWDWMLEAETPSVTTLAWRVADTSINIPVATSNCAIVRWTRSRRVLASSQTPAAGIGFIVSGLTEVATVDPVLDALSPTSESSAVTLGTLEVPNNLGESHASLLDPGSSTGRTC